MKFILGLLALFILPGAAIACWDALVIIAEDQNLWVPLLCGFATGIPLYFTLIKKIPSISTFEHELTHAIVALLFFRKIHKFIVTGGKGGQVQYSGTFGGEFGTLLIGLAPYYLPTFTLFAALARPLLHPDWFPWFDLFIGLTLAFHVFSTLEETKLSWTKRTFRSVGDNQQTKSDIGKSGYILAFLVIMGLGAFFLGLALQLTGSGYQGIIPYLKSVGKNSCSIYQGLISDFYENVMKT